MARGRKESGDRFDMNYATGYGVRVHILLPDQTHQTYCGKRVYNHWVTNSPPAANTICKNCKSAAWKENSETHHIDVS
jgi:hypothetical protein